MIILVYSKNPLSELEKSRIKGIMTESKCPNESLVSTFKERYGFMQGDNVIYFDGVTIKDRHTALTTQIEV